ncbi:Cysteine desulfurase/selenocysteine lyase [Mycoplasma haemocanis str. Illinois]|uniref:Cysteine desulfurase/selenocysteine lyase n=1 Tax=Mycoplasma haemocanis (strain Illinois) TaxID=1111676 RepID=H6N5Z4_MYCHN|nr:aminotransferase class V-fold PLP-dependent enzyme [Mycoplasma haemocanis]AEW45066.1 Cysteine desulfurase/selenocysteine lyase [Mycoplasma haemocanis str. Illinois]
MVDRYCEALSLSLNRNELISECCTLVAEVIGASPESICIFPNATYAVNELALSLNRDSEVYLTDLEHSSNHAIWITQYKNVSFLVHQDLINQPLSSKPSIYSLSLMSNLEGKSISLSAIEEKFRNTSHTLVLDATQYVRHQIPLPTRADYLFFSLHKILGPNGIGILYSRRPNPELGLGILNMKSKSDCELDLCALYAWNKSFPLILEDWKNGISREKEMYQYFLSNFPDNEYVELVNTDTEGSIFLLKVKWEGLSSHDYAFYLAKNNVIVRAGLSCSWISSERYDSRKVFRVSLSPENTREEIDFLFFLIKKFEILDCF